MSIASFGSSPLHFSTDLGNWLLIHILIEFVGFSCVRETQLVKHITFPLEYVQGLKSHKIQMLEFYSYFMHAIPIGINTKVSIGMDSAALRAGAY